MESLQDEEYPSLSAELLGLGQPDIETSRQVEQLEHGVYFVRNVLSKAECDAVLAAASRHMHMIKGTLDSQRYRDLKRSIFMCPEAAETVYKRLQCLPLFKDSVEVLESDKTFHQGPLEGASGVWQPYGLNSCWRVLKYEPEGHFSPHFDSEYIAKPGNKSLRTFMIYLNDVPDSSGGGTLFVSTRDQQSGGQQATNSQQAANSSSEAEDLNTGQQPVDKSRAAQLTYNEETGKYTLCKGSYVRLKVKPEAGAAVVFNHNMLHSGEELIAGEKWVMRSEVMYEQTTQYSTVELTEDDKEAQKLLKEAEKVEEAGLWLPAGSEERKNKLNEAVEMYSRIRKLSSKIAKMYGL